MFHNSEIQMKKQQTNEQIARVIEREQVISYKKKPTTKPYKESKDEDDEIDSAPSLKSGVFSDDSVRFNKKNTPLPQLNRQKKRIFSKNLMTETKQVNNYLQKQVRQHDNLVLKQKNNYLTTENMKLKTKIMNLEKDNNRLVKIIEEDQGKVKTKPGIILKDNKIKGSQSLSLKMTIKNLRKQLDDQKKENEKIKWSIKFTTINELQCEREAIMEETTRLRRMLEEEQMKRAHLRMKQQGVSYMEQRVNSLNEKCMGLMRQNNELNSKLKKVDEVSKKTKQLSDNQKNLSKMLFNARRVIKEKEREIQGFKIHSNTQKNIEKEEVNTGLEVKSSKDIERNQIFNNKKRIKESEKRVMSKSAQKYRKTTQESSANCDKCQKLKDQNDLLVRKVEELNLLIKEQRDKGGIKKLGEYSRDEITAPSEQQVNKINRFLTFRFKAHHLNLQEAEKYLINSQVIDQALNQFITIAEMAQYLVAEPFSIISGRYLQIFLIKLFYPEVKPGAKVTIDDNKKMKKEEILKNFKAILPQFMIMQQTKEEEMFIQVAQLITNYHQHILTALNRKKNGEGTIEQGDIIAFFNQIELQKEFIDFIITQIILESLDLEHLNYYSMFEIFYMPPQQFPQEQALVPNKKKFQVDHNQIVKEEDQEYEQSRSYVDVKQKTQSQRDEQELSEQNLSPQQDNMKNMQALMEKEEKSKENPNEEVEEYEQLFEQQKMDRVPEEEKDDEEIMEDEIKPYKMEQLDEEYQEDFQSPA